MLRRLAPRIILIVLAIAVAGILLYPTVRYETMSNQQREKLQATGELSALKAKIIREGLDLQGGIHLVLEVDVPTLVQNLAINKSQLFNQVMQNSVELAKSSDESFLDIFLHQANTANLRLVRYYPDRGIQNSEPPCLTVAKPRHKIQPKCRKAVLHRRNR
ncbi:MAG: hypothetical protein P8Y60_15680 [Calditrichota bacterium]